MHKRLILALAATTLAGFAAAPAHAATRMADLTPNVFADRCLDRGGEVLQSSATLLCRTAAIAVACEFRSQHRAHCVWEGRENLAAVNRLIGMPTTLGVGGSSIGGGFGGNGGGNGGGGGGIDLPDLPIDNGGGGGGIDLPDLPIDNGGGGGGIDLPDLPINNG